MKKQIEHRVEAKTWPGAIFDHQDDEGGEFQKLASWWPAGVTAPHVGFRFDSGTFAAQIKLATGEVVDAYPLDSPEDAMASALYFYRYGLPRIGAQDKTAAQAVERTILDALTVYGLELPEGYKRACFESLSKEIEPESQEIWAGNGLPVTTLEQMKKSAQVFEQYRERYSAADQIKIANKLKRAATKHGVEWEHPLAKYASLSSPSDVVQPAASLEWAINKRLKIAEHLDHSATSIYVDELHRLHMESKMAQTFGAIVKLASELEQADLLVSLHGSWGDYIPDPATSVVVEHETDPHEHFARVREQSKTAAGPDWSKLNFDALESERVLAGPALEALRKNANLAQNLAPEIREMLSRYLTH